MVKTITVKIQTKGKYTNRKGEGKQKQIWKIARKLVIIFSFCFFLSFFGCHVLVTLDKEKHSGTKDDNINFGKVHQEATHENKTDGADTTRESIQAVQTLSFLTTKVVAEETSQLNQSPENKYAYLTFDDGPNTFFTGCILDILAEQKVTASFAVIGQNAQKNPELIKRIAAQGHAVINHTYTHNYKKIYASVDALIADLEEANLVLKNILGHPVKVFRAPGGPGNLNKSFSKKLEEQGYLSISWNISGGDSDPAGVIPEQVFNNVTSGLKKVKNLNLTPIILLHDGTQITTTKAPPDSALSRYVQSRESVIAALPKIIDLLRANGYAFGVVDENTPSPW